MDSLQLLDTDVKQNFYLPALAENIFCTGSERGARHLIAKG